MPTNHAAVAALPITADAVQTLIRNLLVQRMAYVVTSAAQAADLVAVDPTTGTTIIVIVCLGRNYLYDSTDTTTAHDGTTCLVTSDGKRYKLAAGSDMVAYSVLGRDSGDSPSDSGPPVSPSIGDAYLVPTAGTGDWAGHDDEIAIYTARGWEFVTLEIGRLVYVEDEDAYYRITAGGVLSLGFGANALAAASVLPSMLLGGGGRVRWIVENQTTNAQPAASDGVAYVIGSSPTGAIWAGNPGKIAHGEGGTWVIYTPAEGWKIYDKALDQDYVYSGLAWVADSGAQIRTLRILLASETWSKPARLISVRVTVQGGGGNYNGSGGVGTAGGTTSFGAHCSATGGNGGNGSTGTGGAGGTGTGGDTGCNLTGESGQGKVITTDIVPVDGGRGAGPLGAKGQGGSGRAVPEAAGGGGGGCAIKEILAAALGLTEVVSVGSAAMNNGFVMVEEITRA